MTLGGRYGIYVECERCKATLGGEQVTANPNPPLTRWQGAELREAARALGWVGPMNDRRSVDFCPACAPKEQP